MELLWKLLGALIEHNEEHGEREHSRGHDAYDLANFRQSELGPQMATRFNRQLALAVMMRARDQTRQLLCWAVLQGDADKVKWLLENGGAEPNSRDDEGDPVLHLMVNDDVQIVDSLVFAGADVDARDRDGATPLVLACINGRARTVLSLLSAGAAVSSKWQHLTPVQWATVKGHDRCVDICVQFGGQRPGEAWQPKAGQGIEAVAARFANENRLRPPLVQALRRKRVSAKSDSSTHRTEGRRWPGASWVKESLLRHVLNEPRGELVASYPDLAVIDRALRAHLFPGDKRARLSEATVDTFSLRPGIRFRRDTQDHRLAAAPTVAASLLGVPRLGRQFVDIEPDSQGDDEYYKHYFGELLLCFVVQFKGETRELCLIKYLYPADLRASHACPAHKCTTNAPAKPLHEETATTTHTRHASSFLGISH